MDYLSTTDSGTLSSPESLYRKSFGRKPELPPSHTHSSVGSVQKGKRKRLPVNCQFCRTRKLKCDRQHPCSNCTKKNNSKCVYAASDKSSNNNGEGLSISRAVAEAQSNAQMDSCVPNIDLGQRLTVDNFLSNRVRSGGRGQDGSRPNAQEMRKRLDKMESLVMQLIMQQQKTEKSEKQLQDPKSLEDDVNRIGESLGMLKLDKKGKSVYHGDTHWGYLFSEVVQIQDFFSMLRSIYENEYIGGSDSICEIIEGGTDYMAIPFAGTKFKPSSRDLLNSIPPKHVCAMLIDRYFVVLEPVLHIVHRPTFEQQLARFWLSPENTDLLWVALLFAMMVVGLQSFPMSELPDELRENPTETWTKWLDSLEMCGFIGRLTVKPSLLNMRVLLLWIMVQSYNGDFIEKSWTSMGLVIRVAQSMGLHRDPQWFSMSSFEAQERRRIWSLVSMLDTQVSIGQGLPFGIRTEDSDMEEPLNIDDLDSMPEFGYVPQAKSMDTRTNTSFTICRSAIIKIQRQGYILNTTIRGNTESSVYADVWRLDERLRETYENFPPFFRKRADESDLSESLDLIIQRFFLEIDFLRTIVILHRLYASQAAKYPQFAMSKESVMDASCKIVERHYWLCTSSQATAIRNRSFWVTSSLTFAYVTHAAMYIGISLWNNYDDTDQPIREKHLKVVDMGIELMGLVGVAISADVKQSVMVKILLSQVKEMGKMTPEQRRAKSIKYQRQENVQFPGTDSGGQQKGFTMDLDASDVDFRLDYLKTANNQRAGRKTSSAPSMDFVDEYSPPSFNTSASTLSGSSKSVTDDSNPSFTSMPSAQSVSTPGYLVNDPLGLGNGFQDGFGDGQRMQQIVGAEEWDNFMRGLEQEGIEGLKPLSPYF